MKKFNSLKFNVSKLIDYLYKARNYHDKEIKEAVTRGEYYDAEIHRIYGEFSDELLVKIIRDGAFNNTEDLGNRPFPEKIPEVPVHTHECFDFREENPVDEDCFASPVLYKGQRVLLVSFCMENNDRDLNQEDTLIIGGRWEFETVDEGLCDVRAFYNMVNRYELKRIPGFNYGGEG